MVKKETLKRRDWQIRKRSSVSEGIAFGSGRCSGAKGQEPQQRGKRELQVKTLDIA